MLGLMAASRDPHIGLWLQAILHGQLRPLIHCYERIMTAHQCCIRRSLVYGVSGRAA